MTHFPFVSFCWNSNTPALVKKTKVQTRSGTERGKVRAVVRTTKVLLSGTGVETEAGTEDWNADDGEIFSCCCYFVGLVNWLIRWTIILPKTHYVSLIRSTALELPSLRTVSLTTNSCRSPSPRRRSPRRRSPYRRGPGRYSSPPRRPRRRTPTPPRRDRRKERSESREPAPG